MHVTVALSGQGADELLGGYRKHRAAAVIGQWRHIPRGLRRPVERAALRAPGGRRRVAEAFAADGAADRLLAMSSQLHGVARGRLVRGRLAGLDGGGRVARNRCAAQRHH